MLQSSNLDLFFFFFSSEPRHVFQHITQIAGQLAHLLRVFSVSGNVLMYDLLVVRDQRPGVHAVRSLTIRFPAPGKSHSHHFSMPPR